MGFHVEASRVFSSDAWEGTALNTRRVRWSSRASTEVPRSKSYVETLRGALGQRSAWADHEGASIPLDPCWRHLWRIRTAAGAVLAEAQLVSHDEAAARSLLDAHHSLLVEVGSILSDDLRAELQELVEPFVGHELTGGEAMLAQAQLVGWLTGLMAGVRTGVVGMRGQPGGG